MFHTSVSIDNTLPSIIHRSMIVKICFCFLLFSTFSGFSVLIYPMILFRFYFKKQQISFVPNKYCVISYCIWFFIKIDFVHYQFISHLMFQGAI